MRTPPSAHRCWTEAVCPREEKPKVSTPMPMTIIAVIATTLMVENQNSSSPKTLTDTRFAASSTARATAAVAQTGTAGHQ